ncbi:MAG: sigma-70 family RNA polymerase sigma factor [Planctomycetota bacterium]
MARPETLFDRYRRRGDLAALAAVFDRTAPELLRIAMHFARHPAEAEDLLQETFLTAIVRADAYDAERPLVPWLVGILRNHAHTQGRRARRALGLAGTGPEAVDASADAWMDVEWSEAIEEAVDTLPEPYRQVLVLRLRHDRAPAEIAVLLDRSPATVRSQIHRGLDLLRRRLPPDRRSPALAALPVGGGLAAIRERVVAHGAQLAVAPAVGALPLVLGGLAVKKALVATGVLVAFLATTTTLWVSRPEPASSSLDGPAPDVRGSNEVGVSPTLVGAPRPDRAEAANRPGLATAGVGAGAWPPDLPIPADKGSVAGRIRFADGTPLVGARVALWGSVSAEAITDAQGRYHIHAEWVHPRAVFLRLGRDDQPDSLGLILSSDVEMRGGALVMRDVVLDRGIDLESVVVDAYTGKPVGDVNVVLRRQPLGTLQARAGFLRTDAEGRFRFPYVPHATYTLELSREGYQAVESTFEVGVEGLPPELSLEPARALVIQLENLPEDALGMELRCRLARTDGSPFSISSTTTIARDGMMRLDAPEPGAYRLSIARSSRLPHLERDIQVPEGRIPLITWRLEPSARVTGTVTNDRGDPLSGGHVDMGRSSASAPTDADGAFEIPFVPAGSQTARVRFDRASIVFGQIDVPTGSARIDLRAPGTASIAMRVLVRGSALDGMRGGVQIKDESNVEVASGRPDPQGRIHVPLLAAGSYEVLVWSGSTEPHVVAFELAAAEAKDLGTVELRSYERVPVRFVVPSGVAIPHGRMAVRVLDPDSGASLLLHRGRVTMGVWAHVLPDERGADQAWITGLPVRRVRLELSAEDFQPATLDVDVKPGLTEPLEVRLEPK